jgi:GTP cyclohydrolase I
MEAGIRLFLEGLGDEASRLELAATPERVARAWAEDLVSGYAVDPASELTWTPAAGARGPVLVRRVSLVSICVHHLLPFFGFAHVAYLPAERIAGLSKIGRIVDAHARRLQTQERLTSAIVETLAQGLAPAGVLVVIRAEHTCMTLRGVRKEQSRMLTVGAAGRYEREPALRQEALALLMP